MKVVDTKIAIIGGGNIGQAMAHLLRHHNTVQLWDSIVGKVPNQLPLEEVVRGADFVFLCVPSFATREALGQIKPFLSDAAIIISLSKGVEHRENQQPLFISQVIAQSVNNPFGLLGGPMLAGEIKQGMKASAVFGCTDQAIFDKVCPLFENSELSVDYFPDADSVAMAGVLKNVYAITFGIISALNWGNNLKGWFMTKIIHEMSSIIQKLNGQPNVALTLAGLGDMIATGQSPSSRNHQMGKSLVEGTNFDHKTSEGFISLPPLIQLIDHTLTHYPIIDRLQRVIDQHGKPKELFDSLFHKC